MKEQYSRQKLCGRNFSNKDLSWSVFRWSNLEGANFDHANLEGANLIGINASHATFRGANLKGASLVGAKLYDCIFDDADLTEADLRYTDQSRATFARTICTDTVRVSADLTSIGKSVLHTDTWTVHVFKDKFRIGCMTFTASSITDLTLEDIDKIDPGAVAWAIKWLPAIMMIQAALKNS